jgi:hypothetical protein
MNLNLEELNRISTFLLSPNSYSHKQKADIVCDLVLGFQAKENENKAQLEGLFFKMIELNDLSTLKILSHNKEVKKIFNQYLCWENALSKTVFTDLMFRKFSFILDCSNPNVFIDNAPNVDWALAYLNKALEEGYRFTQKDWIKFAPTFKDSFYYQSGEHIALLLSSYYSNSHVDLHVILDNSYFSFPCLMSDLKKDKFKNYGKHNVLVNGKLEKLTPNLVSQFTDTLFSQNYSISMNSTTIENFCTHIDSYNKEQFTSEFSKQEMLKLLCIIENKDDFIQALKKHHLGSLCIELEKNFLEKKTSSKNNTKRIKL